MSVQTAPPLSCVFDRDLLLRAYSALREESDEPTCRRRSLIRQIWLPSEWLDPDDEDCGPDEPACVATHGEAAVNAPKPAAVVLPPRVPAPSASFSAAPATTVDDLSPRGGASCGGGRADTADLGLGGNSPGNDGSKTTDNNSSPAHARSSKGNNGGSSSSSVRTTLNLHDNLNPSNNHATNGVRRAIGSSALNLNVSLGRGQANTAPAASAKKNNGSSSTAPAAPAQAQAAAAPEKNGMSAEQEATAALTAMLGLSALKASGAAPAAPVPPPRNTSQNVCLAAASWSSPAQHLAYGMLHAADRAQDKSRLNPNATEFRPFLATPGNTTRFPPPAAALPPPRQSPAPPKTSKSCLEDDFGGEMTNLLGQQLCDEMFGGLDMEITPSSARTSVGTSRETEEIDESERLQAERMLAVM